MQKKIIALAVAGLMSGAAFAQSNVTIYGQVDVGYRHDSSSVINNIGAKNSMAQGGQLASRLGFRGEEDLGGGNKVGFTYEFGIAPDEGDLTTTNVRQSTLHATGSWGTLQMGRQLTPQNIIQGKVDPFLTTGVGAMTNVYATVARLDNLFAYVSPTIGGFTGIAGYTWNGINPESRENQGQAAGISDAKVWALAAMYNNGPIFAGFNYHKATTTEVAAAEDGLSARTWDLAFAYDFGFVRPTFMYGKIKANSDLEAALGSDTMTQMMLGATAPLGNGKLMASYAKSKISNTGASDDKASQWAIGYQYDLSKRTDLYVKYGKLSYNNAAEATSTGLNDLAAPSTSLGLGNDTVFYPTYKSSLAVGLRHVF